MWNAALAPGAPIDPHSEELVSALTAQISREESEKVGPWINATYNSVPIYTVSATQAPAPVKLESGYSAPALVSAWSAVPLPSTATPAKGGDAHLVVWQPSTERLWEFWKMAHTTEGWHAGWGGAIEHVAADSGVYGPEAWTGATIYWGASATSLSIVGGLITLEDLERGQIDHALAMALPKPRAYTYASPAERDDAQWGGSLTLPEGARLRLDPNLDLSKLSMPPITRMIAEAAQKYGIVVRDKSKTIDFYAQDPVSTGTNPYAGSGGYFEGKYPNELLASFPWSHLQVLQMELHKS